MRKSLTRYFAAAAALGLAAGAGLYFRDSGPKREEVKVCAPQQESFCHEWGTDPDSRLVQIETVNGGRRNATLLKLNRKVMDQVFKDQAGLAVKEAAFMMKYLTSWGGVFSDARDAAGTRIPAVRIFDEKTGALASVSYFDRDENKTDPDENTPASQRFNAAGARTGFASFRNDAQISDRTLDPQTGKIVAGSKFERNQFAGELTPAEIAALNRAAKPLAPLPDAARQRVPADLKPFQP